MTRSPRLRPLARAVLRTQSDERLIALARDGREPAFEEIVRRYRPGLVAFAAGYVLPERAEDVVQESFISSWQALRSSTEEIRLKPWLYTIVRNRALNARRDARPQAPLSDDLDGVRQPDDIVLGAEELAQVVAAVQALPEAQREALVRSALDGYSHEQIAAALGASPGAVRQLVYRARLAVRHAVGLAVPLPLVRVLSDFGAGEATTAAIAGGTAVAGGTSALTKGTVVAVVGALALGSGVAIKRAGDRESEAAAARIDRGQADRNAASGSQPLLADGSSGSGGPGGTAGGEGRSDDDEREPEDRDDDRQTPGRAEDDPGEAEDELGGSGPGGGGSGDDDDVDDSDTGGHGDQVSSGTDDDAEPQTVDQDTAGSSGPSHSESEHADSADVSDEPDELDDSSGPTSSGPGPSDDDDADEPTS